MSFYARRLGVIAALNIYWASCDWATTHTTLDGVATKASLEADPGTVKDPTSYRNKGWMMALSALRYELSVVPEADYEAAWASATGGGRPPIWRRLCLAYLFPTKPLADKLARLAVRRKFDGYTLLRHSVRDAVLRKKLFG